MIEWFKYSQSDILHAYYKEAEEQRARKSKEAEMLSDLEIMDILKGSNQFENKDCEFGNSA